MRHLLLLLANIPGLRWIVWRSAFLQRIAGFVIHVCIPKIRCEPYGFVMTCDYLSPTFLGLCASGGYEKEAAAFVASQLRPGNVVIDLGANEGFYSILASRIVGEEGRVLAVEPDAVAVRCLRRNLNENGCRNVDVAEVCAGDAKGTLTLHVSRVSGVNSPVHGNVIGPSKPLELPCRRVDDLVRERNLQRVDLIKMDVQGWESACLRGMEETIRRFRPVIVFEFWPKGMRQAEGDPAALLERIRVLGYRLRAIEDSSVNDADMSPQAITEAVEGKGDIYGKQGSMYGGYANIAAVPVAA